MDLTHRSTCFPSSFAAHSETIVLNTPSGQQGAAASTVPNVLRLQQGAAAKSAATAQSNVVHLLLKQLPSPPGQYPTAAPSTIRHLSSHMPPKPTPSSKPTPSQKPLASTAWNPTTIFEIGHITPKFRCLAHTDHSKPCQNPIKNDNRTRAKEILLSISATSPASNAFESEVAELLDILLCWRHREDTDRIENVKSKWTRAMEEFVRKGGDEVMGEADDTIGLLDAEISDLMVRRMRLVDDKEDGRRAQIKKERGGGGYLRSR